MVFFNWHLYNINSLPINISSSSVIVRYRGWPPQDHGYRSWKFLRSILSRLTEVTELFMEAVQLYSDGLKTMVTKISLSTFGDTITYQGRMDDVFKRARIWPDEGTNDLSFISNYQWSHLPRDSSDTLNSERNVLSGSHTQVY